MKAYIDSLQDMSHKQLVLMLARQKAAAQAAGAVTGMAMRFPGGVNDTQNLWQVLSTTQVKTGPLPDDRWDPQAPRFAAHHQALNHGGFIDSLYHFDPDFFSMSEQQALHTDPQQRVLLELAVEALTQANLTKKTLSQRRVGVFTAISTSEHLYGLLTSNPGSAEMSPYMGSGSSLSASAGLLAYQLGLNGPALTVEAACASSLVAVHQAMQCLRNNECDIALVGSAHFLLSPLTTVVFDQAQMLSANGQSRPWDAQANGHVRAEGAGVLVLKRKQDALKDNDEVFGLIKGSAIFQQGQRAQVQASSGIAQQTVIAKALKNADVTAEQVCYVEGQGTGSALGGVVEAESLIDAYQLKTERAQPLYLGSAKANFGHMESASGMLSIIKTLTLLQHQQIPPQAHFDQPDGRVDWQNNQLAIATELTPVSAAAPIAGISSFGFSGTCVHMIVQAGQANVLKASTPDLISQQGPFALLLSAHSRRSLQHQLQRLRQYAIDHPAMDTAAVCHTLGACREVYDHRFAVLVNDRADLIEQLASFLHEPELEPAELSGKSTEVDLTPERMVKCFLLYKKVDLSAWFTGDFNKVALPGYVTDSQPYRLTAARFS